MLYCALTGQLMAKTLDAVKLHMKGKKFLSAKGAAGWGHVFAVRRGGVGSRKGAAGWGAAGWGHVFASAWGPKVGRNTSYGQECKDQALASGAKRGLGWGLKGFTTPVYHG